MTLPVNGMYVSVTSYSIPDLHSDRSTQIRVHLHACSVRILAHCLLLLYLCWYWYLYLHCSKDLELKVREMKRIVECSQRTLYECGKSQADFWHKCFDDLPEDVRLVLIKQLLASKGVWLQHENSPMKSLLQKCELIENDRLARAAAAAEKTAREQAAAQAEAAQARLLAEAEVGQRSSNWFWPVSCQVILIMLLSSLRFDAGWK